MAGATPASQRILPPPELDCTLATSKWSPPFPVYDDHPLTATRSCAGLREARAPSMEGYFEAGDAMPLELRSHPAVLDEKLLDERHGRMSKYEGL